VDDLYVRSQKGREAYFGPGPKLAAILAELNPEGGGDPSGLV